MLNAGKLKRPHAGFTLVELMLAIAVFAVLLSVAVPSFRTWLQNIQTRNAAESILNGIQRARAEAVTLNRSVVFTMGSDSSWTVAVPGTTPPIESRPASEGSRDVTRTVMPAAATTVTFNNLGLVVANADASATLTQVNFTATGGSKNYRVTIGVGGNARMCDPSLPTGSTPTAC